MWRHRDESGRDYARLAFQPSVVPTSRAAQPLQDDHQFPAFPPEKATHNPFSEKKFCLATGTSAKELRGSHHAAADRRKVHLFVWIIRLGTKQQQQQPSLCDLPKADSKENKTRCFERWKNAFKIQRQSGENCHCFRKGIGPASQRRGTNAAKARQPDLVPGTVCRHHLRSRMCLHNHVDRQESCSSHYSRDKKK